MSNASKFVAAVSVAGAMLASSPALFAQELRQVYVNGVYADCYYNVGLACSVPGAYAAVAAAPIVSAPIDAYAAVNGLAGPAPYLAAPMFISRGLRAGDWVAIHGAASF